jgi:hypothetical protein
MLTKSPAGNRRPSEEVASSGATCPPAMVLGVVITSAPPFIVEKVKKRSWVIAHPDPVLVDTETSSTGALKLAQRAPRPLDANDGDVAGVRSDRDDRTPPA